MDSRLSAASVFAVSSSLQISGRGKTAFGIAITVLDGVALAGISVDLPLDLCVRLVRLPAAQRGPGQADSALVAIELVGSGLINFVVIVISQQGPRYDARLWDSRNNSITAPKKGGGENESAKGMGFKKFR